jgi:DNA polymerase III subunit epsilon
MRTALIVDVETTGLTEKDEVIELAALLFEYDQPLDKNKVGSIIETYTGFREPTIPISAGAVRVNKITKSMLAGQRLDDKRILDMIGRADILISHNADFDRSFVCRLYPEARYKYWYCSLKDITWPKTAYSRRLIDLAAQYNVEVSQSHRALSDCETLYKLLAKRNHFDKLTGDTPRFMLKKPVAPIIDQVTATSPNDPSLDPKPMS